MILLHRWPTLLALLLVAVTFADGGSPPVESFAVLVVVVAAAYPVWGVVRGKMDSPRVVAVQLGVVAAYGVMLVLALSLDEGPARVLVAVAWIVHGLWDAAHHRPDGIVPRQWAEWCAVVDVGVGVAILTL